MKALLTHKKTDLIQGFRSRKGDTFSAYLVLDAQGKTTYQYPRKRGGR
ncbi:topoisomerase C-terminal repeat-containing protein [[Clostridium] scindens]